MRQHLRRLPQPDRGPTPSPQPPTAVGPTAEEFEEWCENPVTRFVAHAYRIGADACALKWSQSSWTAGQCDPALLAELRTRADAYEAFLHTNWSDYAATIERSRRA